MHQQKRQPSERHGTTLCNTLWTGNIMSIKKVFVSSVEGGYLIEADYSQLEIYILAHITKCPKLLEDLLSGVDLHVLRAAELAGAVYEEYYAAYEARKAFAVAGRTLAKQLSFQLQYGSAAKGMSNKLGIAYSVAEAFINNYYTRYPEIKQWQDNLLREVKKNRKPGGIGNPLGTSQITSITGRIYSFKEYESEYYSPGFMPTEVKNYLVQGLATGDVVPHMLGVLRRELLGWQTYEPKLIGTVHDSILIDTCTDSLEEVMWIAKHVAGILYLTPTHISEAFNIDFNIPLPFTIKVGLTWDDMKEIDYK